MLKLNVLEIYKKRRFDEGKDYFWTRTRLGPLMKRLLILGVRSDPTKAISKEETSLTPYKGSPQAIRHAYWRSDPN